MEEVERLLEEVVQTIQHQDDAPWRTFTLWIVERIGCCSKKLCKSNTNSSDNGDQQEHHATTTPLLEELKEDIFHSQLQHAAAQLSRFVKLSVTSLRNVEKETVTHDEICKIHHNLHSTMKTILLNINKQVEDAIRMFDEKSNESKLFFSQYNGWSNLIFS
eukprot:m.244829 g.244829  ORF g.244829 m.244829 type:complete len:161 (+) comp56575_c0_seq1:30-512(+)